MAKRLNALLNKQTWTGEELGKLLISSIIHDIERQKEGKPAEALFSQAEFERLERSLKRDRDYVAYGIYTDIYSSIVENYNMAQATYQQFHNGFNRLIMEIKGLFDAENAEKKLYGVPFIVTQKQYDDFKEKARKDKSKYKMSFFSLFADVLNAALGGSDEVPKDIQTLIEASKKKKSKDATYKELYNRVWATGYYILQDGRRSDKMSNEEWRKALDEEIITRYPLFINGEKASDDETLENYRDSKREAFNKLFFKGVEFIKEEVKKASEEGIEIKDNELDSVIFFMSRGSIERDYTSHDIYHEPRKIINELIGYPDIAEWIDTEEPPSDITMFDLLEAFAQEAVSKGREKIAHKAIKENFPELYDALKKYIEDSIPDAKNLKANQIYKDRWTWKELSDLNFFDYSEEPSAFDVGELIAQAYSDGFRGRGIMNKVAIIQEPSASDVDEKGYYEQVGPLSLHRTLKDADATNTAEEIAYSINNLINPALMSLYAYNAFLKVLEDVYDIKDLEETARANTGLLESKITGYNQYLYMFYASIDGNAEDIQTKRRIIKDIFKEIDVEELKPSQQAIKEVTSMVQELGLNPKAVKQYRYWDSFISILSTGKGGSK